MARTGRPREFNRDTAITAAMHLFWQHGYEGASLDQLRRTMGGISSASFYAAFGSKDALYREALQRYLDQYGGVIAALRDETLAPRERLERALLASVAVQTNADHPAGCMVALSATVCSPAGATLQQLTTQHRHEARQAIADCVRAGIVSGQLLLSTDAAGLTALYDALLLGASIQARDGVPTACIENAVVASMAGWDRWAGTTRRPEVC